MTLLHIKQNVKRAWSEGWPVHKVEADIDALFVIADGAVCRTCLGRSQGWKALPDGGSIPCPEPFHVAMGAG